MVLPTRKHHIKHAKAPATVARHAKRSSGKVAQKRGVARLVEHELLSARARRLIGDHVSLMHKSVRRGLMAGVAATAIHKGRTIYRRSFGYADLEHKVRFTHESIGRIYCSSKTFINLTAMMLSEEGRLDLDAPVSKYIPAFRRPKVQRGKEDAVTSAKEVLRVRHLLTHQAGLSYGPGFGLAPTETEARYAAIVEGVERGRIRSLAAFADAVAAVPLCFEPGERYEYGYSTDILGRVLEVAGGQNLEDLLQSKLFKPLNMVDTSFAVPAGKLPRLAALYGSATTWAYLDGRKEGAVPQVSKPGLVRIDGTRPEESAWGPRAGRVFSGGGMLGDNQGGLVSTAADTEAFVRFLLAGGVAPDGTRLISRRGLSRCERNHLVGKLRTSGMRWCPLGDIVHGGAYQQGGAAGNYWLVDRRRELGVVVFMQQVDGEEWEAYGMPSAVANIEQVMRTIIDKGAIRRQASTWNVHA